MTNESLLVILIGVIASTYVPTIILFLWKYLISPFIRIFSFHLIRWNGIHKKIKPMKFWNITSPRREYLFHWYVYVVYGTYYQSEKEIRQEKEEWKRLQNFWKNK